MRELALGREEGELECGEVRLGFLGVGRAFELSSSSFFFNKTLLSCEADSADERSEHSS